MDIFNLIPSSIILYNTPYISATSLEDEQVFTLEK